jgi:hypothetical protein
MSPKDIALEISEHQLLSEFSPKKQDYSLNVPETSDNLAENPPIPSRHGDLILITIHTCYCLPCLLSPAWGAQYLIDPVSCDTRKGAPL